MKIDKWMKLISAAFYIIDNDLFLDCMWELGILFYNGSIPSSTVGSKEKSSKEKTTFSPTLPGQAFVYKQGEAHPTPFTSIHDIT